MGTREIRAAVTLAIRGERRRIARDLRRWAVEQQETNDQPSLVLLRAAERIERERVNHE